MRLAQIPAPLLLVLAVASSAGSGCAPKASSTPLGLGPLALAEQQSLAAEPKPAHPRRRSAVAQAAPAPSSGHSARSDASDTPASSEPEEPDEPANADAKQAAAGAPDFAGLLQINARVPGGFLPSGQLDLSVAVGTASTQAGVTIAVR